MIEIGPPPRRWTREVASRCAAGPPRTAEIGDWPLTKAMPAVGVGSARQALHEGARDPARCPRDQPEGRLAEMRGSTRDLPSARECRSPFMVARHRAARRYHAGQVALLKRRPRRVTLAPRCREVRAPGTVFTYTQQSFRTATPGASGVASRAVGQEER